MLIIKILGHLALRLGRQDSFFLMIAVLLSIFTSRLTFFLCAFFLFILAVPLCKCSGEQLCMSSTFSIAILNGTCSLRSAISKQSAGI